MKKFEISFIRVDRSAVLNFRTRYDEKIYEIKLATGTRTWDENFTRICGRKFILQNWSHDFGEKTWVLLCQSQIIPILRPNIVYEKNARAIYLHSIIRDKNAIKSQKKSIYDMV